MLMFWRLRGPTLKRIGLVAKIRAGGKGKRKVNYSRVQGQEKFGIHGQREVLVSLFLPVIVRRLVTLAKNSDLPADPPLYLTRKKTTTD